MLHFRQRYDFELCPIVGSDEVVDDYAEVIGVEGVQGSAIYFVGVF